MKQFIFGLVALILFAVTDTQAQLVSMAKDTTVILNTKTLNMTARSVTYFERATVQVNFVRNSGTAAGTCTLQGSLDGVNYVNIDSAYTITNVASQSHAWFLTHPNYIHYRVRCTGSGTMNVTPTGLFLVRKP